MEEQEVEVTEEVGTQEVEETAPEMRMVKINGKEVEVPIDEVLTNYQKYSAADEKFRSAAQMRKEAEELKAKFGPINERLKNKDVKLLQELYDSDTLDKFAEDYLIEKIKYNNLSEEQRENLELKKQLAAKEEAEKKIAEEKEAQERQQAIQRAGEEIEGEITKVFDELGKKPTPRLVARMAQHMMANLDTNQVLLPAKDAYKRSITDLRTDISDHLSSVAPEELLQILPKEVTEALRKQFVNQALSQDPIRSRQTTKTTKTDRPRRTEKVRTSTDDFFKKLDQRLGA